jgi:hypothetical protein
MTRSRSFASWRWPPALKAIIALHATDDLYHDDVRYIDGGLHIDLYTLEIDHENALPRTPDYPLDSAYFRDRFGRSGAKRCPEWGIDRRVRDGPGSLSQPAEPLATFAGRRWARPH